VSLVENDREIDRILQQGNHDHSVTTIPLIAETLQKHDWKMTDLNEVIVGVGPGSYTGVRIGVSIAKMIGYLNRIKVSAVSSLALIASASEASLIIPMIDARRGNIFTAAFCQENNIMQYKVKDCLIDREKYLAGFTAEKYETIEEGTYMIEKIIRSRLLSPVENIHELVPNYLQMTEAERNIRQ